RPTSFSRDWSSDVCSSDLAERPLERVRQRLHRRSHVLLVALLVRQPEGAFVVGGKLVEELHDVRVEPGELVARVDGGGAHGAIVALARGVRPRPGWLWGETPSR